MATPQIPDFWPMALGASADTVEIPDTTPAGEGIPSFTSLFPILTQIDPTAGGVFIQRSWMNGLFQLLGNNIWYLQHGCLFPWNATFDYPVGAHVLGSDSNEYVAVQESTNQNPTLDTTGTYWRNRDAFRLSLIGMIATFVSTDLPAGWMICDGSSVLFSDWPEFQVAYAAGRFTGMTLSSADPSQIGKLVLNGSSGVYLPDLVGLYEQASSAANAGGYLAAGLPNIGGGIQDIHFGQVPSGYGAFSYTRDGALQEVSLSGIWSYGHVVFSAASSNAIYSDAINTVQPPSVRYVRAMYLGRPNVAAA